MSYKFDSDFGETRQMPYVTPHNDTSGGQWYDAANDHSTKNDTCDNEGAETWKYGEGQYDYIANDPGYGDDGYSPVSSSHRPPWFHYFVIDNIKYVIAMTVFYFLFTAKIDSLGIEGAEYLEVKREMIACFVWLSIILFFKSLRRLKKMR